ncbi:MAG TPA: shikimate dehydrogenase [Chthoniobacterales bacterium]
MSEPKCYCLNDLRDWHEPSLRYAVLGDPVAHSASPAMHNAALEALKLPERYCRLWIHPDELAEAVRLLPEAGFRGVNLTIPHKTDVLPLLDRIDPGAKKLGAVNTLVFQDNTVTGHNTDGPGIVRAIREEFGVEVKNQRVLILGAGGGAGRAIATQCALEGSLKIVLVNRSLEKIESLARQLGPGAVAVPLLPEALAEHLPSIDLVINATSVGMKSEDHSPIPAHLIESRLLVYDTIYAGLVTPLQMAANESGARNSNGLSLLLHQGALSLEIWLGHPVPLEVMRRGLLDFVGAKSSLSGKKNTR